MLYPPKALLCTGLAAMVLLSGCFRENPAHNQQKNGDAGWLMFDLGSLTPEGTGKPCTGGKVRCLDDCVDLGTDEKNCGACGNACKAGEACQNGSCEASAGCDDGSNDQVFSKGMVGCAGTVTFNKRVTLCGSGFRVCEADEWVDRRGDKKPTYNYWTNDELRYGGASYSCYASTNSGHSCYPGEPMRVCAGHQDPRGNICNWINCGFQKHQPNQYFGGCMKNPTAGSLCCPK